MEVLLFSNDLMSQPKVADAAKAAGMTLRVVPQQAKLLELASEECIVVFDLASQNDDIGAVVARLRAAESPPRAIVAFGPHVHVARLEAAQAAGCDGVFARGQFYAQAAQILGRLRPV